VAWTAPLGEPDSDQRGRRLKVDWLIIGAGFTGSVLAERIASQLDQTVLLVDRRDHIGGNAYDCYDDHGVMIHKYGAHIFHTSSQRVWEYLSLFTEWRSYQHSVLAAIDGQNVPSRSISIRSGFCFRNT